MDRDLIVELFKDPKSFSKGIKFTQARKYFWTCSSLLCLISIIGLVIKGLNFSLEFVGGTQVEIRSEKALNINDIVTSLENANFKSPRVQHCGSTKDFLIRIANTKLRSEIGLDNTQEQKIANKVTANLSGLDNFLKVQRVEYLGSEVGEKLLEQGGIAVIISILVTMLYIAVRFEFKLAISAAITLCHNALIVLGCFALAQIEFDLATLAAILAVIGYSLNDTIVIFDRVRENVKKCHQYSMSQIIDLAINQTLSRTVMTSVLTLLVVLSLLFFGGHSLFGFALALTIGIIVGTYASICIAGSFAVIIGLSRQDFLKTKAPQI